MTTMDGSMKDGIATGRRLGELLGLGTPAEDQGSVASEPLPFPLVEVSVRAAIAGDCAVTELEERFANQHEGPLDVQHTFPLPPGGAVVSFEVVAGGRSVRGACKRLEQAKACFESARTRGKTAAIIESVRDDVHVVSLANVPPRTPVIVKMTIIERLRCDEGRFEYRFPTAISPKFVPGAANGHDGDGTSPDTDRAPDASRLTPPIRLAGGTPLHFEITVPEDLAEISGSIEFDREPAGAGLVRLRPRAGLTCRGDLLVRTSSRGAASEVRAYTDGERTLVVVDPPARRKPELETPRIATFVMDRSGSMEGPRLLAARSAVARAIRGLGPNDLFEIHAFDHRVETFSTGPVHASPDRIAAAERWLGTIDAHGGTETLPALRNAVRNPPPPGTVRTVLLVTDGAVGNDREVLEFTRSLEPATRLFTIGIGRAPALALVDRLARLGGGTSLFIEDSADIGSEISRFESALAGPMACGLSEAGSGAAAVRDLFAGRSAMFFIDGPRDRVRVASVDGRFTGGCEVRPSPMPLGALRAHERITELEDQIVANPDDREVLERQIVELGERFGIQTRLTAFVAVDENSQVDGDAIRIVQPVEAPADHVRYLGVDVSGMDLHRDMFCCQAPDTDRDIRAQRRWVREAPDRTAAVTPAVRAAADRIVRTWTSAHATGTPDRPSFDEAIRLLLAILVRRKSVDSALARLAIDALRPHRAQRHLARFLDAIAREDLGDAIDAARDVTGVPGLARMLLA